MLLLGTIRMQIRQWSGIKALSGILVTCRVQHVLFRHCSVTTHCTVLVLMRGATDDTQMWHDQIDSLLGFLINNLVVSVASVRYCTHSWYSYSIAWWGRWRTYFTCSTQSVIRFSDKALRFACRIWVHNAVYSKDYSEWSHDQWHGEVYKVDMSDLPR